MVSQQPAPVAPGTKRDRPVVAGVLGGAFGTGAGVLFTFSLSDAIRVGLTLEEKEGGRES